MHCTARHLLWAVLAFCSFPAQAANGGGILVFGAARGTGLEVVRVLAARGEAVAAFVRPTSATAELESLKVRVVVGDALDREQVASAVRAGRFRAIISTLGRVRNDTALPPDVIGTKNIVDAAKSAGIKRLIVVTIVGPGQLTNNPRSGIIKLSLEPEPTGPVTRGDLADMVVLCLDRRNSVKKIYQVIGDDPKATVRMDRQ